MKEKPIQQSSLFDDAPQKPAPPPPVPQEPPPEPVVDFSALELFVGGVK